MTSPAEVPNDQAVRLRLLRDPSNVTIGDKVHEGAIATLADLTAMAAAWCGAASRWSTVKPKSSIRVAR